MMGKTLQEEEKKRANKYNGISIAFLVISIVFVIVFFTNRKLYYFLLLEDSFIEWLTFAGLFISSVLSLKIAIDIKKQHHYWHLFFVIFFGFALLAGLEEISWGQRIFQIQSNEFFNKYNDQHETNLHNTFQGVAGLKTKHIALLVLFIYGVVLPMLQQKKRQSIQWLPKIFIIPPHYLILPFLIATAFMIDFPTGMEEEIGEFFYSVCFVFLMIHNYHLFEQNMFDKAIPKR